MLSADDDHALDVDTNRGKRSIGSDETPLGGPQNRGQPSAVRGRRFVEAWRGYQSWAGSVDVADPPDLAAFSATARLYPLEPFLIGYPHEFSGGQRQRIAIARALSREQELIVLDEPVSSLDVSIRAQSMNLLRDCSNPWGWAYLLIAHDLAILRHMCDRLAIRYLGRLVETGNSARIYRNPLHPYTRALLASMLPTHPDQGDAGGGRFSGEIPQFPRRAIRLCFSPALPARDAGLPRAGAHAQGGGKDARGRLSSICLS